MEHEAKARRQDPYILAYQYTAYMQLHPTQHLPDERQRLNSYYKNLLANQPEPDPEATDDRSRAVRYAKEHFECYYEVRDVARIIRWIDEAEDRPQAVDVTSLLNRIRSPYLPEADHARSPSQKSHESSSP